MSGTASPIQMTFLKRVGNTYSEYPAVPVASSLNYSTDVRQFSGAFDFSLSLGNGETFVPGSHDLVEFWVEIEQAGPRSSDKVIPKTRHQLGVGYLEDFVNDSSESTSDLKANGRDLIGQLVSLAYSGEHLVHHNESLISFTQVSLLNTYLANYLKFRGGLPLINDQGAYPHSLLVVTGNSIKRGATLQNYAELAINLMYQNPRGQVEIYGKQSGNPSPIGVLCRLPGKSNVSHIRLIDNFSKVVTQCTTQWSTAEEHVKLSKLTSNLVKNTDPRVTHIFQPETKIFSAGEMVSLAGNQTASTRIQSIAKSTIRRSMANVGAVTIVVSEPFYTDEVGNKTVFRVMQDWHIQDPKKGIDKTMRLAGINYSQDFSQQTVQLAFVEPDTLV